MSLFSEELTQALDTLQISPTSLANQLRMSHPTIGRWKKGDNPPDDPQTLELLANTLPEPWGERVMLAWLRDHCSRKHQYLLAVPMSDRLIDEGATEYSTKLDRAIKAIRTAAAKEELIRRLVFDLGELAAKYGYGEQDRTA